MPEEQNPSSGGGATPNPDPAMGTPASSSATPTKPPLTVEELVKRVTELEQHASNKAEEAARHGKSLSAAEKELAAYKAAEQAQKDAQLSEIERTKKQHSELQAKYDTEIRQYQERLVRYEVQMQASALGIIDPEAAAKLLDWSELDYEEDGTPKNAKALLETLLKNKPYLGKPAEPQQTPAQSNAAPRPPAVPAMNPGRTSIPAPGTQPQAGKPVGWSEAFAANRQQR